MELADVTGDELEGLLIKVDNLITDYCDTLEEENDSADDTKDEANESHIVSDTEQSKHEAYIQNIIAENLLNKKLIPHDFETLCRLFYLFKQYQQLEYATELVQTYGHSLVQQQEHNTYEATIRLAEMEVEIEKYRFASLMRLMKSIEKEPTHKQNSYDWYTLRQLAQEHKHFAIERICAERLHDINLLDNDDDPALAKILLTLTIAESFVKEGINTKAEQHLDEAFSAFNSIQGINNDTIDQLLIIAEHLIALRGEQTEEIIATLQSNLVSDMHSAHKRDIEVKIARILAQHYYKNGNVEQAIEKGFEGYYGLTDDYDEPEITRCLYDWLYESKDYNRLCWLLFNSGQRIDQQHHALALCKQYLDEGIEHPALPALLVIITKDLDYDDIHDVFSESQDTDKAIWVENTLAKARQWAHSEYDKNIIDMVEVIWKYHTCSEHSLDKKKVVYKEILPIIEKVVTQYPEEVDQELATALLVCRAFEYGLEEMFDMPFVPLATAGWCYNMGNCFDDDDEIAVAVQSLGEWPKKKADALAINYYKHGLQRFENYFESGNGVFRDGDIHVYSMLCNNLAIELKYLYDDHDIYDESIEIHKKGIAVSPFAEHYDGIMKSYSFKEDDDNYLIAADELWRFAIKHGYSRFDVYDVIKDVASVYNNNHRNQEVAIWLPRLEKWWQDLEDYEQDEDRDEYLLALSYVLAQWVDAKPDDTLMRLTPEFLKQVEETDYSSTPQNVGAVYETTGNKEKALYYFNLALNRAIAEQEEDNIKNLERIIKNLQKPWWKFW